MYIKEWSACFKKAIFTECCTLSNRMIFIYCGYNEAPIESEPISSKSIKQSRKTVYLKSKTQVNTITITNIIVPL